MDKYLPRLLCKTVLLLLILGLCAGCTKTSTFTIIFASNAEGNYEIYKITSNGQNIERLTNTSADEQDIVPSPDGRKVIFDYGGVRLEKDIFLLNVESGVISQLTSALAYDIPGTWSPHGDQLSFISDRDGGYYWLYVMKADGSDQRRIPLETDPERSVYRPKCIGHKLSTLTTCQDRFSQLFG